MPGSLFLKPEIRQSWSRENSYPERPCQGLVCQAYKILEPICQRRQPPYAEAEQMPGSLFLKPGDSSKLEQRESISWTSLSRTGVFHARVEMVTMTSLARLPNYPFRKCKETQICKVRYPEPMRNIVVSSSFQVMATYSWSKRCNQVMFF